MEEERSLLVLSLLGLLPEPVDPEPVPVSVPVPVGSSWCEPEVKYDADIPPGRAEPTSAPRTNAESGCQSGSSWKLSGGTTYVRLEMYARCA